jgi:hypothetical protein
MRDAQQVQLITDALLADNVGLLAWWERVLLKVGSRGETAREVLYVSA